MFALATPIGSVTDQDTGAQHQGATRTSHLVGSRAEFPRLLSQAVRIVRHGDGNPRPHTETQLHVGQRFDVRRMSATRPRQP